MIKPSAFSFSRVMLVLGLLFLYLPMFVLIVYSFNASRLVSDAAGGKATAAGPLTPVLPAQSKGTGIQVEVVLMGLVVLRPQHSPEIVARGGVGLAQKHAFVWLAVVAPVL